jgi:hypothetical protein
MQCKTNDGINLKKQQYQNMKIFLTAVLAASLSAANAVLPPGYEDEMYCPPDDCKFYTNPFGYVGAESSFYFCYSNSTGNVTDGVWTGNLTNVTAPEGWEEPEECTKEEYSECDYDSDCIPTVRTMVPLNETVWGACACFADSVYHPFDQCEGQNETTCVEGLLCEGDPCEDYTAVCEIQDNGAGACMIAELTNKPTRKPTRRPSYRPTKKPSRKPSRKPSKKPSKKPSHKPTEFPTEIPTPMPSPVPTEIPTPMPSDIITSSPTDPKSSAPTPWNYFPDGGQCSKRCLTNSDCRVGGFNPCGYCGQVVGTIMYHLCFAPNPNEPPPDTPAPSDMVTSTPTEPIMPMIPVATPAPSPDMVTSEPTAVLSMPMVRIQLENVITMSPFI